ncbi:MAG TPA: hypothetical protein VE591_04935 [Candidatus Acidoferrum sp.]|jgi:hypothetical protein|nr:hypothetical protein [Candidatus Acidoferrum sp.]
MLGRLFVCCAVAAFAVPAAIASAQSAEPTPATLSGASPVSITACGITRRARYRNIVSPYPLPITGGLRIAYVNHGSGPAKEIRVRVDYRGESEVIVDSGTFSPGALVSHSFDNFSDYAYLGPTPNVCAVVYVRFADGTVWSGVPRGQMRRPL